MYVDLDVCVGLKMGFVGVGCLCVCVENLVDPVFVSCFLVGHPGCLLCPFQPGKEDFVRLLKLSRVFLKMVLDVCFHLIQLFLGLGPDLHVVLLKSFAYVVLRCFVCLGYGRPCSACVGSIHHVDFGVLQTESDGNSVTLYALF